MSDIFPSSTEVCIVGAGPSGLACAIGLAARQIPFVIVDALSGAHKGSRAIGVSPAALESLGALDPQVPADLVAAGLLGQGLTIVDRFEKVVVRIPTKKYLQAYTKYPHVLIMQQHVAEQTMRQFLQRGGNSVHYNKRVCDIAEFADGSQYKLEFESGEVLTARYIVAADGSKSVLRSFAGIPFIDPYTKKPAAPGPNDPSFVVADVLFEKLTSSLPRDGGQVRLGEDGMVLTAPMLDPSLPPDIRQNFFRIYIGMSDTPPREPDIAYLQAILDRRGPGSLSVPRDVPKIAKLLHSSRYRTRSALADTFLHATKGGAYILLAGDAAHTHGPAGGQGMNLGICDGCELAVAIDEHRSATLAGGLNSFVAVNSLEAYAKRRRAMARKVIDMVYGMTELEKGGSGWMPYLRVTFIRIISRLPFVLGLMAWNFSGLGRINLKYLKKA